MNDQLQNILIAIKEESSETRSGDADSIRTVREVLEMQLEESKTSLQEKEDRREEIRETRRQTVALEGMHDILKSLSGGTGGISGTGKSSDAGSGGTAAAIAGALSGSLDGLFDLLGISLLGKFGIEGLKEFLASRAGGDNTKKLPRNTPPGRGAGKPPITTTNNTTRSSRIFKQVGKYAPLAASFVTGPVGLAVAGTVGAGLAGLWLYENRDNLFTSITEGAKNTIESYNQSGTSITTNRFRPSSTNVTDLSASEYKEIENTINKSIREKQKSSGHMSEWGRHWANPWSHTTTNNTSSNSVNNSASNSVNNNQNNINRSRLIHSRPDDGSTDPILVNIVEKTKASGLSGSGNHIMHTASGFIQNMTNNQIKEIENTKQKETESRTDFNSSMRERFSDSIATNNILQKDIITNTFDSIVEKTEKIVDVLGGFITKIFNNQSKTIEKVSDTVNKETDSKVFYTDKDGTHTIVIDKDSSNSSLLTNTINRELVKKSSIMSLASISESSGNNSPIVNMADDFDVGKIEIKSTGTSTNHELVQIAEKIMHVNNNSQNQVRNQGGALSNTGQTNVNTVNQGGVNALTNNSSTSINIAHNYGINEPKSSRSNSFRGRSY